MPRSKPSMQSGSIKWVVSDSQILANHLSLTFKVRPLALCHINISLADHEKTEMGHVR